MRRKASGLCALFLIGSMALVGCRKSQSYTEQPESIKPYFAKLPTTNAYIAISKGDFDGDGDLDLVVGVKDLGEAKLYFFENDGKGNFRLKPSTIINPKNYQR